VIDDYEAKDLLINALLHHLKRVSASAVDLTHLVVGQHLQMWVLHVPLLHQTLADGPNNENTLLSRLNLQTQWLSTPSVKHHFESGH